ncbi:PRP40 pre-mRNA processing factor 40 [Geranomyces michiganensis]|nr:PRP40 pre-mRNA processing factor 40 [Geranomyces michiganensis]
MAWNPHGGMPPRGPMPSPHRHWPPQQHPAPGGPMGAPYGAPPAANFGPPPAAIPVPQPEWTTHTTSDGKVYYFNTKTKQSSWEKPDALKTEAEKATKSHTWKEYATDEGKKYFYNTVTKVTTWEMPAELKAANEAAAAAAQPAKPEGVGSDAAPSSLNAVAVFNRDEARGTEEAKRPGGMLGGPPTADHGQHSSRDRHQQIQTEFNTREEAEAAFESMLVEKGVEPTWTWEETLAAIINHPLYRALNTLSERQAAFERYVDEKRREEAAARKMRYDQQRVELRTLFADQKLNINSRSRYRKVSEMLADNDIFRSVNERDRENIFLEYVDDLKTKEKELVRETRKENTAKYERLLQRLTTEHLITLETTWVQCQELYKAQPEYRADRKLQAMEPIDFLLTFEHHINDLVAKFRAKRDAEQRAKWRKERLKRDAFRALLSDMRANGTLHARTRWQEVLDVIKEDERYLALLHQKGSTPVELFGDAIVDIIDEFRPQRRLIEDVMRTANIKVLPDTEFKEFCSKVRGIRPLETEKVKDTSLRLIFSEHVDRAMEQAAQAEREEKRRAEKKLRRKMDAFKSLLRKLSSPAVSADADWEAVRARVAGHHDYEALEEPQRIEAFQRVLARLREKAQRESGRRNSDAEDDEEEGSLKDAGDHSDRKRKRRNDRDRDRDREHANAGRTSTSRRSGRSSRHYGDDSAGEDRDERGDGGGSTRKRSRRETHASDEDGAGHSDYDDRERRRSSGRRRRYSSVSPPPAAKDSSRRAAPTARPAGEHTAVRPPASDESAEEGELR